VVGIDVPKRIVWTVAIIYGKMVPGPDYSVAYPVVAVPVYVLVAVNVPYRTGTVVLGPRGGALPCITVIPLSLPSRPICVAPAVAPLSDVVFLSLEVGTNLSRDLRLELLRIRLVPVRCSGLLSAAWFSAGALLLLLLFLNLLKKLPPLRALSASLREAGCLLSPVELSGLFELVAGSFPAVGANVLLLLNALPRELLQRLKRLLDIEEDLAPPVEVPTESLLLERAVPLSFVAVGVRVLIEGARVPILLPRREVQRELMRLLGLIADGVDVLDVGDRWAPIGLPMREVLLELA